MDWISVKDRLPEEDATYLVYGRNWYGIVVAIYYGDGKWLTCDDLTNITRFVTHWMPMPEPPKEAHPADDHINGYTDFSKVWKSGWNHGAECILDLAEKHDLATIRQAFENLKAQEENPPE